MSDESVKAGKPTLDWETFLARFPKCDVKQWDVPAEFRNGFDGAMRRDLGLERKGLGMIRCLILRTALANPHRAKHLIETQARYEAELAQLGADKCTQEITEVFDGEETKTPAPF